MKRYFAWKQLKIDYSTNIWEEQNHGQDFTCPLLGYISVQINYWKLHSVGAGAHKSEKIVYGQTLTLIIPIIGVREKGIYIEKD